MQKSWTILFLLVPILCIGSFIAAPFYNWWLPENISTFGGEVDHLFIVILVITSVAFVGTQAVLVYAMFKYTGKGSRARYIHNNHQVEFVWTVVPALILIFIAFYQFKTWAGMKIEGAETFPSGEPFAEVLAGQFEWRIRYPGPDEKLNTLDDLVTVNDFHVPMDKKIKFILRSRDVLHSFFVPNLRVKQDAVPGMEIPVWFQATKEGTYDLVCAELCGWGHYKMRGRLVVETESDYRVWMDNLIEEQSQATPKEAE